MQPQGGQRPVARHDSSPELMLINQIKIKTMTLKILIIVFVVCGERGVEEGDMVLDIILDEHLPQLLSVYQI